jgi:hypothetical protein
MTTNTGQQGKRAGDKNTGVGQLGQERLGRTARTGQPGPDSRRLSGWYTQDKKKRTGWPEHDRRTGQLRQGD